MQFLFGDPLVTDTGNRFKQSPFDQAEHGFVVNFQKVGHFFGGIDFHGLTHVLDVAAPHQQGTKPHTRLFSVMSSKEIGLAEMHSPSQMVAGLHEKTALVVFVDYVRLDKFFIVRVFD
jgi:hypothetical protein